MSKKITRRDFLRSGTKTIAALGAVAGTIPFLENTLQAFPTASPASDGKTRVVVARNEKAINNRNQCNQEEVSGLFDNALFTLTGKNNAADAWRALGLTKKDVVAIKVNCNTWTIKLTPHQELVQALSQSLNSVIPLNQIIFYERSTSELESGGFTANKTTTGVRYFGSDDGGGFDDKELLTRIVSSTATKIINLASLKCVEGDFVASLFFKNHIGTLRSQDMPKCHGDLDFLAEVNSRPSIKNKTILNICNGLRGTFRRGVPWYWSGIVMGTDPVASEYAVIDVINQKRKQEKLSPLDTPKHLIIAQNKYKLGTLVPAKIDLRHA